MEQYWKEQIARLGRNVLYVDTGAIVGAFERGGTKLNTFFDQIVGFRFVTSTYVIAESVRRIVKSRTPNNFVGPAGEKTVALALHLLRAWLDDKNFTVLCIPEEIFNEAKRAYPRYCGMQCDLTDVISLTIVHGLEQKQIVSPDSHFRSFGLQCLP
jgi:predicted nucleic acid-binding protein